jgi:predicted ester cyclase
VNATPTSAEDTIRRCVDAYNRCTTDWVDRYYAAGAEWLELPTRATPQGRSGSRDVLHAAAVSALAAFPDRQMVIGNLVAAGQQVAAELDWRGTAQRTIGTLQAGTAVRLRIASFFTVVDGLIVKHTDYCVPATPA